ncbi:MAG: hypothetical protein IJZ39_03060 [Oscillospiraceae bacterium]|nr:hypothetical protein [Oscillospiraceae bacterium]
MNIDINALASWVAIALTLILSILVPVFNQIANNRFQLKKAKQDRKLNEESEKLSKKFAAYEGFLMDVGAAIEYQRNENMATAGASIGRLYLYVPNEWHKQLDELYHSIRKYEWGKAEEQYIALSKLLAEEYRETEPETKKKK